MLGQRVLFLQRELAVAAWRWQQIEHDQRSGSPAELEELRDRILGLSLEINQLEAAIELADHPEIQPGEAIAPEPW